jgi:hypothetical protein
MTSQMYMYPVAGRARITNRLWVNKASYVISPNSTARKLNPITRQNLPKHKAYRPPRRPK